MWVRLARRLMLVGIAGVWLCVLSVPVRSRAQVDIHVGIQLPPPLVFSAPPEVVVLPRTYVYVVPDIDEDVFFFDGWWWRPWQGRWYRSRYYERGWAHYSHVPSFYREVPQGWRHAYHERQWEGRGWNYERVPHERVEKNWNAWKREGYWEKHRAWGVQGLERPRRDHGERPQSQPESHGQQPHTQTQRSQKPGKNQGGHDHEDHGKEYGKSSKPHGGKKRK